MKIYIKILISTFFTLTGITKIYYLLYNPKNLEFFYYIFSDESLIFVAVVCFIILDFLIAIFIFYKNFYRLTLFIIYSILLGGIFLSLFEIIYNLNSNCGCGLQGDVYSQLFQKLFILIVVIILNFNKNNSKNAA